MNYLILSYDIDLWENRYEIVERKYLSSLACYDGSGDLLSHEDTAFDHMYNYLEKQNRLPVGDEKVNTRINITMTTSTYYDELTGKLNSTYEYLNNNVEIFCDFSDIPYL